MSVTGMMLAMGMMAAAEAPPPVVGGTPADEGAWPDVALIWNHDEPGCTGTLVEPDLILTAAHCAKRSTHVSVGHTRLRAGERVKIRRRHIHPEWAKSLDIAALRLVEPIEDVEPRALSVEGLVDGATVTIVGWGATNKRVTKYPRELMQGDASVWDADCSQADWGCNRRRARGMELVAGADAIDSCDGDSGGPLYLGEGPDAVLVGVTSRAVDGWGPPCGNGGVYVRADAADAWLDTLPTSDDDAAAGDDPLPKRKGNGGGGDIEDILLGCTAAPVSVGLLPVLLVAGMVRRRQRR